MKRYLLAGVTGLALAGLTGLAFAATHPTLKTADNASVGKTIVVDSRGLTVYELRGETSHHLLCKTKACYALWPMVTVKSKTKPTAAKGVKGRLGVLHRGYSTQLTLNGHPLYRFSGDNSTKGQATGDGLKDFGGTWHVVAAGTSQTTTITTPPPPPPPPGY
jgi:predicted lipoprotein with Yx(FWY)xxD motif